MQPDDGPIVSGWDSLWHADPEKTDERPTVLLLNLLLFQNQSNPQAAPGLISFLPILLIFAIFYLLLFLPMQRQRKKQQTMLRGLQNGSVVLTSGGIIGTITELRDDDTLVLRVEPAGVKLQMARSAVTSVISGETKK